MRRHAGVACERAPGAVAGRGCRTARDVRQTEGAERHAERTERKIHGGIAHRDQSFALRAREEMLTGLVDKWRERVHRTASFTFFIASATRERAASSLQPSVSATSA